MKEILINERLIDNNKYLVITLPAKETIYFQTKMIKYNQHLSLINIEIKSINNINELSYEITNYVSIYECLKSSLITIEFLLKSLIKILDIILEGEYYLINSNNVLYNSKNVYYDVSTNEVKLIYVPMKDTVLNNFTNRKVLLLNLLFSIKERGYRGIKIEKAISIVRDELGDYELLKRNILEIINDVETGVTSTNEINSDTKNVTKNIYKLFMVILERGKSRVVELSKDIYLIGRLEAAVDIVIKNSSVGRIHGRIEKEQNNFFYIDLNSKNGSYINGEKILPNKRYLISNGTKIKIASVDIQISSNRGI